MTNYFENCKTSVELKATYKELVKKFHPDVYGEKGNEILKDIHNQLEKATKTIDKKYYSEFNNTDKEESADIRAKKEELAKQAMKDICPYYKLFALYYLNNLKPANHRNPLTKHNFSGWNVWQLELEMILKGYTSCEWSTFNQIRNDNNSVNKGEKGAHITLAIYKWEKDEETGVDKISNIYYKGYTVFNKEQTAKAEPKEQPAQIAEVKAIETKQEFKKQLEKLPEDMKKILNETTEKMKKSQDYKDEIAKQKTLDLWGQQNIFKIA